MPSTAGGDRLEWSHGSLLARQWFCLTGFEQESQCSPSTYFAKASTCIIFKLHLLTLRSRVVEACDVCVCDAFKDLYFPSAELQELVLCHQVAQASPFSHWIAHIAAIWRLTQLCVLDQPLAVDTLLYRLYVLFANFLFRTCEFVLVTRWSDVIRSDLSLNLELMTPGITLYTYMYMYIHIHV